MTIVILNVNIISNVTDMVTACLTPTAAGIESYNDLLGHPVSGSSYEPFVIESLLQQFPQYTAGQILYYCPDG